MLLLRRLSKALSLMCCTVIVGMVAMGCQSTSNTQKPVEDKTQMTSTESNTVEAENPLNKGYQTIDAQTGKSLMDNQEVILLDVRTQEEFNEGHIPKALLLPVDDLGMKASEVLPDKEATIIVYCRSGNRSATASELLVSLGYTSVYDMGGIIDWPYDVVKP